jgi:hypothetical protein
MAAAFGTDSSGEERIGIIDVKPEEGRSVGPPFAGITSHHGGIADPGFGMAHASVGVGNATQFLRAKCLAHEVEKAVGILGDDPWRDSGVAVAMFKVTRLRRRYNLSIVFRWLRPYGRTSR